MTFRKEGEGVSKAFRDNRAYGLGHKSMTEGGEGLKICVTSFMNAPLRCGMLFGSGFKLHGGCCMAPTKN